MKLKARLFIFFAFLIMAIIPAINYNINNIEKKELLKWLNKTFLYKLDFALPRLSQLFYPFGISIAPNQVLIGSDNWLFIGDKYGKSLTNLRKGVTESDKAISKRIALVINSWDHWLKSKGVEQYQVMLIADKQTVYKEFLPQWIQAAPNSFTDNLFNEVGQVSYLDTRPALENAKSKYKFPLYYKTDSHWNLLGGWVAYDDLSRRLAKLAPELNWLMEQNIQYGIGIPRGAGDLSHFLWLTDVLGEHEISVKLKQPFPIEVSKYAIETGVRSSYTEPLRYHYTTPPVIIHSKNALNNKKILFLVDSFGEYLSQYITATFRDTLQIHYGSLNAASLALAVETFKPDYVVVAVIERDARTGVFKEFAPISVIHEKTENFVPQIKTTLIEFNDLIKNDSGNVYKISGSDPYMYFKLLTNIRLQDAPKLMIDFKCKDKVENIPIQLFWISEKVAINETNSIHINIKSGLNIIDMTSVNNSISIDKITSFRLDVDSLMNSCRSFNVSRFELGK